MDDIDRQGYFITEEGLKSNEVEVKPKKAKKTKEESEEDQE